MIRANENKTFKEKIQIQYSPLGYKIDLCFHDHKIATETDENGHSDRNIKFEIKRQKKKKKQENRTRTLLRVH